MECSLRPKTTTMTFGVATALFHIKEPGGIVTVIGQTLTACITVDSMTLMQTELTGTLFEDITTPLNVQK